MMPNWPEWSRKLDTRLFSFLGGGCQTDTRLNIPHFNNPFSCYEQHNNYLTNSSQLTLIRLNFAFKHTSLTNSDFYK